MGTAPAHDHELHRITDPISGHLWEMCSCGFSIDINVLRGRWKG